MSSVVPIQDVPPYTQSIAAASQTVFDTNWTADEDTDVVVYARADGAEPDDVTDLVDPADYTISYIGVDEDVRVTFLVGRTVDDIVTIMRATPIDRLNLYTNTNFTASMLNGDFGKQTMMIQEREYSNNFLAPKYNNNATVTEVVDTILPILGARQGWRKNAGNTAIEVYDLPDGNVAPGDAKYLIQTADGDLPNAQVMGVLASGFVVNTTTTGVQLTRTMAGTANQLEWLNADGIAGNPTVKIVDNPVLPGTAGMGIPEGTTAQRVIPVTGIGLRFNTTTQNLEYYNGGWIDIEASTGVYLPLAGGTMTGNISLGSGFRVTDALDPSAAQDYATKNYVDTGLGGIYLPLAGGTMAGVLNMNGFAITMGTAKITGLGDPTANQDAATKFYVDQTALNGTSVYAATTATLNATQAGAGVGATLTDASGTFAAFSVDGQSPAVGDNILNKDQANAAHQGIYTLTTNGDGISIPWVLTRATSYNTPTEINNTGLITVRNGLTLAGTQWYNSATIATVDTTSFSYSQFGATFLSSTLASGKIFRGNGSNLAVASTAQYPDAAGASGNIMTSDGTNWVSSTPAPAAGFEAALMLGGM